MTYRSPLLMLCILIGLLPFAQTVAQEKLPPELQGRWVGTGKGSVGQMPIDFAWSVKITKQNPDGSLEGTMNYDGPGCSAKNAPMTGTFDGTELAVKATLEPEARCRTQTFRVKKTGGQHLFEGKQRNREGYLDPR